mgnify:CR=1 FL=1
MRYIVFLGAVIGALFVAGGLLFSKGAPQEAAAAAMGLAFAVIPYVIFRVSAELTAQKQRAKLIELLSERE